MQSPKDVLGQVTLTGESESPLPECKVCGGSGYVYPFVDGRTDFSRAVTCQCRREQLAAEQLANMLKFCQLPASADKMTFEGYETYQETSLIEALNLARQLAGGDAEAKWLTLIGNTDLGKTHLAVAACKQWLARGRAAKYVLVPQMLAELRDGFKLQGEQSYRQALARLQNVDLLVLDDLGTEKVTEWGVEQLQMIIDNRLVKKLALIVTTNRSLNNLFHSASREEAEWVELASQRIASRLQREPWCRVVVLKGREHRLRQRAK